MTPGPGAALLGAIGAATGEDFAGSAARRLAGGDTSPVWQLRGRHASYVVKPGPAAHLPRLQAEARELDTLRVPHGPRVPRCIWIGQVDDQAALVLEHLDLARLDAAGAARLGHAVAALHRHGGPHHGWPEDNWLGGSGQDNTPDADWCTFFRERRLRPQLLRAVASGHHALAAPGQRLLARLDHLLAGHAPPPSRVHGDLWAGNVAVEASTGEPVWFDPAVHCADRETDLAMAALFGGFPPAFEAAYQSAWPLPPGHERRRPLYQLYHVLNHLNLFGAGYLVQALHLTGVLCP